MMHDVLESPWGRLFRNWEQRDAGRARLSGRFREDGAEIRAHRARGARQVARHPGDVHQGSAGVRQPAAHGRRPADQTLIIRTLAHSASTIEKRVYGRFQRSIRFGRRRADHAADPRAHSREARRRLHRGRAPAAREREAREVPRSARRALRSRRAVPQAPRRQPRAAELRVRGHDAVRDASRAAARHPQAAATRSSSCSSTRTASIHALHVQAQVNAEFHRALPRSARRWTRSSTR